MGFRAVRRRRRPAVSQNAGGKGKSRTAVEDGMCVKTMVLISPMRRARGPANVEPMAPRK